MCIDYNKKLNLMQAIYKRVAVKVGSNVLTCDDGTLDIIRMSSIVNQIATLRSMG